MKNAKTLKRIIFVIAILLIGNSLWLENRKASEELETLKKRYTAASAIDSAEVLNNEIEEVNRKLLKNESFMQPLNKIEISEIVDQMEKELNVDWVREFDNNGNKFKANKAGTIEKYVVKISNFKGDYQKIKELMAYVQNMDHKVTIEELTLNRKKLEKETYITLRLNFYMKAENEVSEI